MASTHKSLRSSTADKRPTTSIADGQIALNTNAASPGLFFKDSAGTDIIKVGPVHVGTTAPNATPATGGSSGNSTGEVWLDTSLTPVGVKIWNGSSWENATPAGSTTVQGLLELATNAETQTGTDTARAVTPAGLQSKVSDSTSTTSSTTIASSTAVKSAYDLANAALPKTGGTITGALEIGTTGSLVFEGATANDYETTVAVTDPTADRTVTIPNQSGNFLISGNASIVNADVNASAAIAGTKISPNFGAQTLVVDTNVLYVDATTDRVGIGTSSATFPLQVETTATGTTAGSNGVMLVQSQASGRDAHIRFGDSVNSTARVGYLSNSLYAYVNGQERLRIDSSGRLGVGTSSPAEKLQVGSGGSGAQWLRVFGSTSNIYIGQTNGNIFGFGNGNGQFVYATAAEPFGIGTSGTQPVVFGTNAVERARIDSSGRLGVGTSSPASFNAVADDLVVSSTGHTGITINAGTADSSNIFFADSNSNSQGQIRYFHSTDSLSFGVNSSDAIRILSSGNVGIGNTSPDDYLTIANTSTSGDIGLRFKGDASSRQFIMFGDPGGTQVGDIMYDHGTNAMRFRTNNNERVRIDSSGVLTAGNSTATGGQTIIDGWYNGDNRLNVLGSQHSSGGTVLAFAARPKGGGAGYVSSVGIAAFARSAIELDGDGFKFKTGSSSTTAIGTDVTLTEVVRIANGGNVGIGASAPAAKLDVAGNQIFTAANPQIQFNAGGPIIRLPSANTLAFLSDSSTERVRIDSSGRLKVGTTADIIWNQTSVDGVVIEQTGATQIVRNGDVPLLVTRNTSTGQIVKFSQAGTERGSILYDGDFGISSEGNLTFDTSGTEKVRIDSSGRLGIGVSSPGSILHARGGSISTPSTASAFIANATARLVVNHSNEYGAYIGYANGTTDAIAIQSVTSGASVRPLALNPYGSDVLVGNTTAAGGSNNVVQIGKYSGTAIAFGAASTAGNSTAVEFYRGTTKCGEIYTTGTSSTTYATSSDYRLKENIVEITDGIARIKDLKPCRFNFISDPGFVVDGFIAHEAQQVVPEAVKGTKDEVDADGNPIYQGIDQSKLVPLLTAALQEAIAKIETLEQRLTDAGL